MVAVDERSGTRPIDIAVWDYDADHVDEQPHASLEDCEVASDTPEKTWIALDGVHDETLVRELGARLDLHELVLEDILTTTERAKVDEHSGYVYVVLRTLSYDPASDRLESEQVSIVLGPKFLVSFEEQPSALFDGVRERLRNGRARLRELGTDFLTHALVDAVVDQYYLALEGLSSRIEDLEDTLLADPTRESLVEIHELKRTLAEARRAIWPLREAIAGLARTDNPLISQEVVPYLRDVYDNTIQVIDTVEVQRDILSGMLDLYLSSVSNRLNEVMKILTIISTIFIPLTFIVGVYGMNFRHMPELGTRFGYPLVWATMAVITWLQVRYYRRKGWL